MDQSERVVLVSKNTDKLSTEVPPDEEYLKLFQEEQNVKKMYNFTFGKVTQNSAGEVRIFFGEMKHPVGDMKQNS